MSSFFVFRAIAQFVMSVTLSSHLVWYPFFIPIQAFIVTIFLGFWHSELLHFDVQSHRTYSFKHLESPSFRIFYVQSRLSSVVSFRVTVLAFMFTGTTRLTFNLVVHLLASVSSCHTSVPMGVSLVLR